MNDLDIPENQISLHDYKLFRNDRVTHAGGVAIYVHSSIMTRVAGIFSAGSDVEYIFVETKFCSEKCLFGCVYNPPKVKSLLNSELENFLNSHCHYYGHVCIGGDFNFNILSTHNASQSFTDFILSFGLQFVNSSIPSHFTSTLLDLFLVLNPSLVNLYDQVSLPAFSRHALIYLELNLSHSSSPQKSSTFRDFTQIDRDMLLNAASNCNWDLLYKTI